MEAPRWSEGATHAEERVRLLVRSDEGRRQLRLKIKELL